MTRDKGKLTDEDKALWDEVTGALELRSKQPPPVQPNPVAQRQTARDREPAAAAPKAPTRAAPQNRANEKRVRRGKLDIGGSLDLHGQTQASAHVELVRFLRAAQNRDEATVIVITGVGRGGEGALKRALPEWLAGPELREIVSGFAPAHRTHGGAGAFYVFIRRKRLGNQGA